MRKRYRLHLQGREHLDRWLVSYADYMTLIFALFVVLYSVAIVNKEEYRAVIEGMTQAFNQAPRSDGLLERGVLDAAGAVEIILRRVGPGQNGPGFGIHSDGEAAVAHAEGDGRAV